MIILFEENEKSFSTIGLGVLKDATSCIVKEKLNDEFTLTMEYPVKGNNFSKIRNNRIICVKPNPYSEPQAFRIYNVTKAINGRVIVDANHISYDTNSVPVKAFSAKNLQDAIVQIQNGSLIDNPFELSSDISYSKTYKTTAPFNLRAILMSDESSLVTTYDAELEFDNYVIKLLSKRGRNRGAIVRYGHNMTDINHTLSTDLLYNGVFPYYHTEKTTTDTKTSDEFQQVYIVGSKTYQDGWLSYSKDGEPYHPIDESPVQIATEGEYYQKVYCWNTLYNVYEEKIYNEQITLIQGITEPSWLTIDWSRFPLVICKAARKGYYKKATDTDWGEIKGVGDIIYEGSIVSSGLMENLIINFSEVIPSKTNSSNEEVTEVVDVQLDQPILWIETSDAKSMLHDRILMLDLTSEFEEEPSKINLKAKAEEYIQKHKIGTIKHSTTLSFLDLSSTSDGSRFENLDHVELGDTVKIIYEDANIEIELRVISTEYDAIAGRYTSIELGEKKDKISNSTIQNGDNVSALTNDAGYATVTTVNKLIANIVTANYIEALNAKLSNAQISQLSVERINCTGIMEASQFTIDSLVAKLLVADNAEIADTLTAGNIKVAGDIAINSGQITIKSSDGGTQFIVDRDGNLTANSVSITGGSLNINDGVFEVTNDGVLTATAADITGTIRAKEGEIASFIISERQLHYGTIGTSGSVVVSPGTDAVISNLDSSSKSWAFTANDKFGVTTSGVLYAKDAVISGSFIATSGYIANFRILEDRIATYNGETTYNWSSQGDGIYLGSYGLKLGEGFKAGVDGTLTLTKGSITIKDASNNIAFRVTETGELTATNAYITGDVDITSGSISIKNNLGIVTFGVTDTGALTASNANITGVINASSGKIGSDNYYFTIGADNTNQKAFIYSGVTSLQDTSHNGVYIGTDGIRLGSKFYVDNDGTVHANDILWIIREEIEYSKSNQGDTPPSTGWDDDMPVLVQGDFLWSRTRYLYNNNTYSDYMYVVSYISEDGQDGQDGKDGKDGQDGQDGSDGLTPYIGQNGNWWIGDTDTGTQAEGKDGSDADVTWTNILEAFHVEPNSKGIIYGQDADGNAALLINASAGNIAGWTIYKGYLGYGTLGNNDSCFISTSGLTGTVAGHAVASTETDANKKWGLTLGSNFGVTLAGVIYADSAVLSSATIDGEINATSGSIGGFDIEANKLSSTNVEISPTKMQYGSNFQVASDGTLTVSNANISISNGYESVEIGSASGFSTGIKLGNNSTSNGGSSIIISESITSVNTLGYLIENTNKNNSNYLSLIKTENTYPIKSGPYTNPPWGWSEGIRLYTQNYNNVSGANAKLNIAELWIGYYKKDWTPSSSEAGYPNDVWCKTGFFRDKCGDPVISCKRAYLNDSLNNIYAGFSRSGGYNNTLSGNSPTLNSYPNEGIGIVTGTDFMTADTWSSGRYYGDEFYEVITVLVAYGDQIKASLGGSKDIPIYYVDRTNKYVYWANDSGYSEFVSYMIIGLVKNNGGYS